MKVAKRKLTPREGMRRWYERELELFHLGKEGLNDYDRYVPAEAREEVRRLTARGSMPRILESHFALWEALLDVLGWDCFEKPLGLRTGEPARRLLGKPFLMRRGQPA